MLAVASRKVAERRGHAVGHAAGGARGKVLLVEDDPEVAALAREMLAALGFGIVHVDQRRGGARRARQRTPRCRRCSPTS